MDESEPEGSAGEVAGQGEPHPLERYFAMPPGGWPGGPPDIPSDPRPPKVTPTPDHSPRPVADTWSQPPPPPPSAPPPYGDRGSTAAQPTTQAPPERAAAGSHERVRLAIIGLALVLVAGGVIGGIVSTGSGPPAPGAGVAPANFVVSSTQTTLSQHTADIAISGTVSANGKSIPMHGTGTADFDTNSFEADISLASGANASVEHDLVVADHVYIGLTVNGTNASAITGGPEWISVPLADQNASSLGAGNVDPLDQLKLLEQRGATVVPLGTSTVDGLTVSGYAVTFSAAVFQQREQQEVKALGLSPSEAQQVLSAAEALGPPRLNVYFDGSGLLRQESVSLGGGSSLISGSVQMTFSNFGTPVTIEPPASSDVIAYSQFAQDAQAYDASHQG
jgi:hypothetical protein